MSCNPIPPIEYPSSWPEENRNCADQAYITYLSCCAACTTDSCCEACLYIYVNNWLGCAPGS